MNKRRVFTREDVAIEIADLRNRISQGERWLDPDEAFLEEATEESALWQRAIDIILSTRADETYRHHSIMTLGVVHKRLEFAQSYINRFVAILPNEGLRKKQVTTLIVFLCTLVWGKYARRWIQRDETLYHHDVLVDGLREENYELEDTDALKNYMGLKLSEPLCPLILLDLKYLVRPYPSTTPLTQADQIF